MWSQKDPLLSVSWERLMRSNLKNKIKKRAEENGSNGIAID
jgi:hypothetical protein